MLAEETFIDVVRERAGRLGERCAFTFLGDGEAPAERLTYAEVDRKARSIAADLQGRGAAGERVLLLFPPGLDFVTAFLGCLYAGAVAVPAYPPSPGRGTGRLRNLLDDAKPRLALTTPALLDRVRREVAEAVALEGLAPEDWSPPAIGPESLAFLQYTSGSTSTPKGVRVTHGNLIANERAIQLSFGQSEESVVVGWLPLYHDMGLIGNVLQPLWCGAACVLMSPLSFLQRPRRWLEAIDRFRGTTSGGPDFAYSLCVRKIPPAEREGLDLSSWKVAFNGAEPVRAATLDAFAEAFAPQGFRREAFYPCYGLAEATLFVSGGDPGSAPRVVDNLVSCGRAWPGERISIVDPEGRELAAGEEGEIRVSGPSVADGYWNGEGFGGFLHTGDLGWLDRHGELFVTGRLKDLIVVRGRNFHPHDVERTAEESHPALRPGGGAAFAIDDGEERLVVVHEVERRREAEARAAAEAIRAAVLREHEVSPHDVVPIRAGTLPKTSSGKVRRGACRDAYLAGTLTRLGSIRGPSSRPGGDKPLPCILHHAARLLRVDSLDPDAPLPLDSLLALELKNRLEEAGMSVSLTALLEGISPRRLAGQVGEARPFEPPAAEGRDHPLSYNQRALWLAWRMAPESPVYNLALAARVSGEIDVEALNRHAVLRTAYPLVDGEPVQRIGGCEIDFKVLESGSLEEEAWRPFDLENGPVTRVRLFPGGLLLLAVHHIAADFWSLGLMLEELAGKDSKDPKDIKDGEPESFGSSRSFESFSAPYAAWSRWQREMLAGPAGELLWAGWREALAGAPTVLDLPADRPRPPVPTHRGGSHPFSLGPELSGKARALAAASGTTLYTVLLSAFAALLHRHTGRDDLLVGAPAAGRTRPGLEEVAGHFVNLLPVRADLSGDPAFSELVARARRSLAGALERQDLPFPVLVERLDPARDPSRPPLVQVVFALEQPHRLEGGAAAAPFVLGQGGAPLHVGRLTLQPVELRRQATAFDLALTAVETGGTVDAVFDYSADLFDESTIERLVRRFLTLLRSAGGRLSELPVLDDAERAEVLGWEEGAVLTVPERCVHEMFEEWADRTPDAPALVGADGSVATYRELEARANRLARHLLAAGAGPETPVALLLERSTGLWTAALAVLKTGGWYVPIDPSHPRERIELLLADCGARAVVTEELLREASELRSPGRPRAAVTPDNLAYGLYTSGSTGRPKAVLVPHRPLLNVVLQSVRDYRVGPGSRVLQWSAPAFDTSALEVFASLTSGAALCLASEEARISGPRLVAEMREREVTWAALTPAAFRFLPEEELPSVETISVGGEALPAAVAARWSARVRLFNAYGPTEGSIYASVHFCRPGEEGAPPIGRPIANARLRVLGPWSREPLPTGVPGELWIGGAPPARGYLGRPDLTAERWMPGEGGARLYRTGDLVRWRPDGELEFLGRIDTQVKLRGVRIEPAEIEAALGSHPRVREALVVPRQGPAGEPVLVAYVVLQEAMEDLSGGLRAFLAERLPAAMVPAAFMSLSELPLTAVGKVDLRALPLPASLSDPAGASAALPRTEMERTVAAVWREVLGVESVGIDRNFFELGGHSLLMARVHTRLCEALGRSIPLAEMFSHATIGSLAARLAGEEGRREAAEDIHDRAASRRAAMDRRRARARN